MSEVTCPACRAAFAVPAKQHAFTVPLRCPHCKTQLAVTLGSHPAARYFCASKKEVEHAEATR